MKRIIKYLFTAFLLFTTFSHVYALEVSKSDITIERGSSEKIELYANSESELSSITFTLVYSTYDIPASFYVASGANDSNPNGITHTISFDEAKNGKILLGTIDVSVKRNASDTVGSVNIHTASGKTTEGETINLNNCNINIKVGTPQEEPTTTTTTTKAVTEVDKNLLERIDSKIVKITLEKDQFDYTVKVDETVKELDLKPIAKDENTKIEISSQKLSELKDKKIVITAKNGDITQTYNIKVNTKEIEQITVDKEEFKADKSYKGKWIVVLIVLIVALILSMLFAKNK